MDLFAFVILFLVLLALLLAALALSRANRANQRHDARGADPQAAANLRDACRKPQRPTEQPKLNEPGDPDRP